jgi:hypothetical protein
VTEQQKRAGVITLEVRLEKPISRQKKVVIELAWKDMDDLLVAGDRVQIDRIGVDINSGPASDAVILDNPGSLQDFTWQCFYSMTEWATAESVVRMVKNDRRVLTARAIQ